MNKSLGNSWVRSLLNSLWLELSYKFFFHRSRLRLGFSGWISLLSLSLGVAVLVVAMALFSGFERTLEKALTDGTGHAQVYWGGSSQEETKALRRQIESSSYAVESTTLMSNAEGLLIQSGQLKGVFIQGLELKTLDRTLRLRERLVQGEFLSEEVPEGVLLGKSLAAQMKARIGDSVQLVLPLSHEVDPGQLRRKLKSFTVRGILDLGKYEFDERFVLMGLEPLQEFIEAPGRTSGLLIRLQEGRHSKEFVENLVTTLDFNVRVREWRDLNANLFAAVRLERVVIFFVLLVIVIAAAFNVAGALFSHVIQKTSEISLLRALGFKKWQMVGLFVVQGMALGLLGLIGGTALGFLLGEFFEYLQGVVHLLPAETYRINAIEMNYRLVDLLSIVGMTLVICFVSALGPSLRAARLHPAGGLRHE